MDMIKKTPEGKIKIKGHKLAKIIGNWLDIPSISSYCHTEYIIVPSVKKRIETEFWKVLKKAGIDETESFTLSLEEDDVIKCHSNKTNLDGEIELLVYHVPDTFEMLIIDYNNERKKFDYYGPMNGEDSFLVMEEADFRNPKNGNIFHRNYDSSWIDESVQQGNEILSILISKPQNSERKVFSRYKLGCDKKFENYLKDISFPIDIKEVYNKIDECSDFPIEEYQGVQIAVKRKLKDGERILGLLGFDKGKLVEYANKVIDDEGQESYAYFDDNGDWIVASSYDSIQFIDNKIQYNLNAPNMEELQNLDSILDRYLAAILAVANAQEEAKYYTGETPKQKAKEEDKRI